MTLRSLIVLVIGFVLTKISPLVGGIENASEIAEAAATLIFAIGAGGVGFGYARRAAMSNPRVDAEAVQSLFGGAAGAGLRSLISSIVQQAIAQIGEELIERAVEKVRAGSHTVKVTTNGAKI